MRFSATEAAFEGFRVVRRAPMSLVFWSLAYIVFMALMFGLIGGPMLSIMAEYERMISAGVTNPSPEDMQPIMMAYLAMLPLALPLGLVFSAMLTAAVARAVLQPEKKAFGYLRLGMDEVRVFVVTLVLGVLAFLAYMGLAIVAGILGALIGLVTGGDQAVATPLILIVMLGIAAVMIWLFARFSLAVPITVAERRIAIFDSFKMTRKRSLPIIGMAIIAGIMSIIVSILGFVVCMPLIFAIGGFSALTDMAGSSPLEVAQAVGPVLIVFLVVQAVLSALQLAVMYAPFSAAYRDIASESGQTG